MADIFDRDGGLQFFSPPPGVAETADRLSAMLNAASRAVLRESAEKLGPWEHGAMENVAPNIFRDGDPIVVSEEPGQAVTVMQPLRFRHRGFGRAYFIR